MNNKMVFLRFILVITLLLIALLPIQQVQATGTKVGLVTDENGVADESFNWMAYQGLLRAETNLGVTAQLYEPATTAEYVSKLQQCVTDGNELCFAVGFSMGDAIASVASANPGTTFAILDSVSASPPSNLREILFNEKEAGYLAGTLAGKMSVTKKIGVVGGMKIPPVVAFAEGYRNGAQCATTNLKVFITYTGTFVNPSLGAATAQTMMGQGADVIFGAAGPTGNGAILYSSQHGVWSIGVDSDQYITLFDNGTVSGANKLLSSAMKRIDNGTYMTIDDYVKGSFTSGTVTYNLVEGGVGLAPYHETASSIPLSVKNYVNNVKASIISGSTNINLTCRFTAKSLGTQDGWVLESGEFSNKGGSMNAGAATLFLGDNTQKKQYRSVISFNTKGLPDNAVITKVTLRVKKQTIVGGGNPVLMFQGFMADVRKGFFYTSPTLQLFDFQAAPPRKIVGPFKPPLVNGWYNLNLTAAKGYINKLATGGGVTQVRLRFKLDDNNNAVNNYLSLYSGNALLVNRPQLVIEYYVP